MREICTVTFAKQGICSGDFIARDLVFETTLMPRLAIESGSLIQSELFAATRAASDAQLRTETVELSEAASVTSSVPGGTPLQ